MAQVTRIKDLKKVRTKVQNRPPLKGRAEHNLVIDWKRRGFTKKVVKNINDLVVVPAAVWAVMAA